ncbi:GNAT family N-acetyltransferase [Microbacterium sp. CIAB417]|uniref:GNAT family N-acetyltransferase n=1 Tax=Microbacterium sp. CIAB417 TaxID=2860287 RepID=UPI001FABC237|nr:GNAT family N-acetyltransferase [Microbacterium sp. CIAB417]
MNDEVRVSVWSGDAGEVARAAELYGQVFAEPPYHEDAAAGRVSFAERVHRYAETKPDFRLLLARDDDGIVGLALGTGIAAGDWWRDRIVGVLPPETQRRWLGNACFSVAELAVAAAHRRGGVAGRLMAAILVDLPYETAVLGCYADATAARRFYGSLGWREIAVDVRIGTAPPVCLLARELP